MRRIFGVLLIVILTVSVTGFADDKAADTGKSEKMNDKIEVVLQPGVDKNHAVAEVTATNVNPLRILSIPLKYAAGEEKIKVDSVSYVDTRAEYFERKNDSLYPARQAVLVMLMSPFKDKKYLDLQPGSGVVARIYFAAKGTFPMDKFQVAPVTLPPNNKFMYVTDAITGAEPSFVYRVAGQEETAPKKKKD